MAMPWSRAWYCSLGVPCFFATACNETFHSRHERVVDLPSFEQRHVSSLRPPRAMKKRADLYTPCPCRPNRRSCSTIHQWHVCISPIASVYGWKSAPDTMDTYDPIHAAPMTRVPPWRSLQPPPRTIRPFGVGHVASARWTDEAPQTRTRVCPRGLEIEASNQSPPDLQRHEAWWEWHQDNTASRF